MPVVLLIENYHGHNSNCLLMKIRNDLGILVNQLANPEYISSITAERTTGGRGFSDISIDMINHPDALAAYWEKLNADASDPFSGCLWVRAWYEAHKTRRNTSSAIIAGRYSDGRLLFILPLMQQKIGPFKVLLRPGRKHSAYFSGLFTQECRDMLAKGGESKFWKFVFSAAPCADVFAIDGVSETEFEQNNPLKFLPHTKSGNSSFRMTIGSDWEQQYTSITSSKTRSNDRRCRRRLSELGKLEYRIAADKAERYKMLRDLMAMKSAQFSAAHVPNPFEGESIQKFYKMLIDGSTADGMDSAFVSALLLDNEPIAVNFGVLHKNILHGLILTMKQGELKRFSPGRLLLQNTNAYLSGIGIAAHDFGIGEGEYKSAWGQERIARYNVLAPLNIKGWFLVCALKCASYLKGVVKRSHFLRKVSLKVVHGLMSLGKV